MTRLTYFINCSPWSSSWFHTIFPNCGFFVSLILGIQILLLWNGFIKWARVGGLERKTLKWALPNLGIQFLLLLSGFIKWARVGGLERKTLKWALPNLGIQFLLLLSGFIKWARVGGLERKTLKWALTQFSKNKNPFLSQSFKKKGF